MANCRGVLLLMDLVARTFFSLSRATFFPFIPRGLEVIPLEISKEIKPQIKSNWAWSCEKWGYAFYRTIKKKTGTSVTQKPLRWNSFFFVFFLEGTLARRKKKQRNRIKVDPRVHVTHGGWIAVKANDDNRLAWEGGDENGKTEGMIKSQPLNFKDYRLDSACWWLIWMIGKL